MIVRLIAALALASLAFAAGCSSTGSSEDNAKLAEWWRLYQTESPEWPAARDRWCALGAPERESLVLNLLGDMNRNATKARGTDHGLEPGWKRAETELLHVDAATAVPILVTTLRTWRDTTALEAVSHALVEFGASDALIAALDAPQSGDSPLFRGAAARTLVGIGGEKAIARVGQELKTSADPLTRGSAVAALARARRSDKARAGTVLVSALSSPSTDPGPEKVLEALEALDEPRTAPAVALFHRDRRAQKDARLATRAVTVLKKLTGVTVPGDDPELWIKESKRVAEASR